MPSTNVAFIDTETTGLDPDRHEIWEVGLILPDGTEYEWQLPVDLARADPIALNIGRFHERRPEQGTEHYRPFPGFVDSEDDLEMDKRSRRFVLHPAQMRNWCSEFVKVTRGLHLAGAVVSFDADRLWRLLRANGECPMWHYHLIDVEALAAGWLASGGKFAPPWDSDALSLAVDVDPDDFDRHTALGDARWAKAIYEAVMA